MPESQDDAAAPVGIRPFWSGALAFGLVTIPVRLYAATRSGDRSLRMVDETGTPLSRQYVCPEHDEPVDRDELVRGYEVSEGEWVTVREEELESLQPEKSREIDLRVFVPEEELDPIFFHRAYLLAPEEEGTKAYRLLVDALEDSGRAGVATFVMRSREYLVAILSREGVLHAETMHFHDEIRSPDDVGLPDPESIEEEDIEKDVEEARNAIEDDIRDAVRDSLDPDELRDRRAEALETLVEAKEDEAVDVPEELRKKSAEADVVDLVEILERRLAEEEEDGGAKDEGELGERTREELYERAKELDIAGRSEMTKDELVEAIEEAS